MNLQNIFSYVIILLTIPYLELEISKLSVTSRKFDPRVIESLRKVTKYSTLSNRRGPSNKCMEWYKFFGLVHKIARF